MRLLIFFSILLCSVSSFAVQVQFKSDSPVPPVVRKFIAQTINDRCPLMVGETWPVIESYTDVTQVPPQNTKQSLKYSTMFTVLGMDSDRLHPENFPMKVVTLIETHLSDKKTAKILRIDAGSHCQL